MPEAVHRMSQVNAIGNETLFPVWLLRSKVSPTRQRVDLLDRPSHTHKLHRYLDANLSLISAPAGFGKSTLLSNWREILLAEENFVCWLSLDKQDNDPLQLLTYIAFSLATGGVPFDTRETGMEFQLSDLSERDFLSLIIHFVAESPHRVVLILDDFENLERQVIKAVIDPLIEYAPNNLHISIATRDDSCLKISNLEAQGQAIRMGANQLRFSPIELNDFLAGEYDHATIQQVLKQTEGWPVAVQMIRSAIKSAGDVSRILDDLTGDATQIASYLSEEIIGSLEKELQDFLMDISLVDRVECEFADHLRHSVDSLAQFGQAKALDALVLPVESVESTYRLHPLFREHLYNRLAMTDPVRLRELHLRAADWFSARGDLVEAVRHALLAGETDHAIDIVADAGGVMLWFKEGLRRLRAIMQLFDENTILNDWQLAMIRCLLDLKDGRVNQARQLYDSTVARSEDSIQDLTTSIDSADIDEFVIMEIVISVYEGKPISDDVCRVLEDKVESLGDSENAVKSNLLTFLCVGNLQRGRFKEARRFGEMGRPAYLASGSLYGAVYIDFHLGDISFAEGNGKEAARYYKRGLDTTKQHFNDDQGMKLVANILISELNYELNDRRMAPSILRSVPRQLEKHEAWFDIYAAGYTTSANFEFDENGLEDAIAVVDRAEKYAESNRLFRLTKLLTCLRLELLLRADRIADARAVLEQSGIKIDDYRTIDENQIAWRERDAAVHAITRLLIREGEHQQALQLLNYFSRQARTDGHVRARMKYKILLAIAHARNEDQGQCEKHLGAALRLFARSQFIRSFLDEKRDLEPLLRAYLSDAESETRTGAGAADEIESVKSILKHYRNRQKHDDQGELVLSQREIEVLQELVQGFSNKVIARRIDVSESTVRFHLRNIFVKLNVRSRLQAATVARQLELV